MYLLHFIILGAADECSSDTSASATSSFLHNLETIQLFVYVFAPLLHKMKEKNFESLKLQPGALKID